MRIVLFPALAVCGLLIGAQPEPGQSPGRVLRVALVAVDFPDQPFVITLPKQSDLFGNPQVDPIQRERVPQFYLENALVALPAGGSQTIPVYVSRRSGSAGTVTVAAASESDPSKLEITPKLPGG